MKPKKKNLILSKGDKEPKFTPLSSTKLDLIKGLVYYANNFSSRESKQFAISWAKKHHPEIVDSLERCKPYQFLNWGFILRMKENGFVFEPESQVERIETKLIELAKSVENAPKDEQANNVVKKRVEHNQTLEQLDYAIDDILRGKAPRIVLFGPKKELKEVILECDKMIKEMNEFPEYFARDSFHQLKRFLETTKAKAEKMVGLRSKLTMKKERKMENTTNTMAETSVANQEVVVENTTNTMAETSVANQEVVVENTTNINTKANIDSSIIEQLNGASEALVFNTKQRFLLYFKANEGGLKIEGQTIKNINGQSFFKKVREEFISQLENKTFEEKKQALDEYKTNSYKVRTRLNNDIVVLAVKR